MQKESFQSQKGVINNIFYNDLMKEDPNKSNSFGNVAKRKKEANECTKLVMSYLEDPIKFIEQNSKEDFEVVATFCNYVLSDENKKIDPQLQIQCLNAEKKISEEKIAFLESLMKLKKGGNVKSSKFSKISKELFRLWAFTNMIGQSSAFILKGTPEEDIPWLKKIVPDLVESDKYGITTMSFGAKDALNVTTFAAVGSFDENCNALTHGKPYNTFIMNKDERIKGKFTDADHIKCILEHEKNHLNRIEEHKIFKLLFLLADKDVMNKDMKHYIDEMYKCYYEIIKYINVYSEEKNIKDNCENRNIQGVTYDLFEEIKNSGKINYRSLIEVILEFDNSIYGLCHKNSQFPTSISQEIDVRRAEILDKFIANTSFNEWIKRNEVLLEYSPEEKEKFIKNCKMEFTNKVKKGNGMKKEL